MKKILMRILAVLSITAVMFAGCAKKKTVSSNETQKNDNSAVTQEQTKNDNEEKKTNKDNGSNKKDESLKKETEKTKNEDGMNKGLFLGMDDSNSLVIVMNDENGEVKDFSFTIDRKLDFENSDIEIGDSVLFKYEEDSSGKKKIIEIKKAQ